MESKKHNVFRSAYEEGLKKKTETYYYDIFLEYLTQHIKQELKRGKLKGRIDLLDIDYYGFLKWGEEANVYNELGKMGINMTLVENHVSSVYKPVEAAWVYIKK